MACKSHDQEIVLARLMGIDLDDFRRKRCELLCYHDARFLTSAKGGLALNFLTQPPSDIQLARTQAAGTEDDPPRPEIYLVAVSSRDGTRLKTSQLEKLMNELRFYITGVGSPGVGKRACRSRQSERDADRVRAIDEAVTGGSDRPWMVRRSMRARDAERRYILTYDDCENVRAITTDWQTELEELQTGMPAGFPFALPVPRHEDADLVIPYDMILKVRATSTPRQERRNFELHLGDEVLCYLIDAACKVLFPGTGIGVQYFTLRLVHRPELMGMALLIDNNTIKPWQGSKVTKSEELIGVAKPGDFDRNFMEVMHMGVMMDQLTMQRDSIKKECKRARLYKAEHMAWHEMDDADKEAREKERELIKLVSG
ncbi:hypothetical protein KVT40_000843 [Elsinoe batatas]|uniref:Uncharacterized protein n=1 Tax=Elsinoe batatas TaxID=2601811 RepID=A0A8K0LGF9_9PEZI|nr:hypothetical protein KVT40_000843 [Elsinoe batatas]